MLFYAVKADAKGTEAAINAEAEGLQAHIPSIVSTITGRQDTEAMYSGYSDRSQGLINVVEWVLRDVATVPEFVAHPKYKKLLQDRSGQLEQVVEFQYEM